MTDHRLQATGKMPALRKIVMMQPMPDSFTLTPGMKVHIVGIGGSGMSAIAQVLLGQGYAVSGSDRQANALTEGLQMAGATVFVGHAAEQAAGVDVVVISSAVPASNVEVVAARAAGIPVLKRAEFLPALTAGYTCIAVAGTHGKTTTAALISHLLIAAGRDPSVIVGGALPALGGNGRAGRSRLFVIEADEYDYMFLGLRPTIAVITNVEHDHPDMFPTPEAYREAFARFLRLLPADGQLILCVEDAGARALLAEAAGATVTTYGLNQAADVRALDARPNQLGGSDFLVQAGAETLGIARLRLPGAHNVLNALAAIMATQAVGVTFGEIMPALASFTGVARRFQIVGEANGVTVVDDYAHHPTEIRVNLAAARQRFLGRRIWAVWQPHTYSRTRLLQAEFAGSFQDADCVIALDIYRSREVDTLGITTEKVLAQMAHPDARFIPTREEAAAYLAAHVQPGDVVLTLGAGDGNVVGEWLLDKLSERAGCLDHGDGGKE